MSVVLLRRRKLGRGSTNGIKATMQTAGVKVVRNWVDEVPRDATHVFRWGCTNNLPYTHDVERVVVNKSESIHWCSDKRASRIALQDADVSVPKSVGLCEADAREWLNGKFELKLTDDERKNRMFVARPPTHAQGRNLFVGNVQDCVVQLIDWGMGGGYVGELINKVAEYRVFVCQGRAVWVARKTPGNPDQVAWNVAQGGRFDNVRFDEWPLRAVKEAIKAHEVSGADFTGVDVMVTEDGTPYILELNSAPSQTSPYRQSCVAKAFDYIVRNGKQRIPLSARPGGYKKFIHPAILADAWVE